MTLIFSETVSNLEHAAQALLVIMHSNPTVNIEIAVADLVLERYLLAITEGTLTDPTDPALDLHAYRIYADGDVIHQDEFGDGAAFNFDSGANGDYSQVSLPSACIHGYESDQELLNKLEAVHEADHKAKSNTKL